MSAEALMLLRCCISSAHGLPQVTEIRSDAMFILLVEKDAAFMRLAEDRFYNTYPCIILTAKGQPDVATRYGAMLVYVAKLQTRSTISYGPIYETVHHSVSGIICLLIFISLITCHLDVKNLNTGTAQRVIVVQDILEAPARRVANTGAGVGRC